MIRTRIIMSLSAAILLFAQAVGTCQEDATNFPRIEDVPEFSGLSERWEATLQSIGAPSLSVAVVKDGKILALDSFGERNDVGDPANVDTMYYIASATKPMVAMAVLVLQDEGLLNIDDRVTKYLPQFQLDDPDATEKITLRDLLCHAPGINSFPVVWQDAYTGQITDERYFRFLREVEPEGAVSYSNVHFTLLGRVIESVTGKSWKDVLDEKIFTPTGMNRSTAYASELYGDDNSALPMIELDGKWEVSPVLKTDRTMHAAGGVGVSARDAASWLQLNLANGSLNGRTILKESSCENMLSMHAKFAETQGSIRREEGFALGWQMGNYRGKTGPMFMHGGGYVGTASYFAFLPDKQIGVAVLANSGGSGNAITAVAMIDVFDRLLGVKDATDLVPQYEAMAKRMRSTPDMHRPTGTNPAKSERFLSLNATQYVGNYHSEQWGTAVVKLVDGNLVLEIGDLPVRLFGTGQDEFDYWIQPDMHSQGRFIVRDDRATEVELQYDDATMTFQRVDE